MKKLFVMMMMVIAMLGCSMQCYAENGAPIYQPIDEKTGYTSANDENIALVKMVKPNYTEEYEIQFFRDYFVVLWVAADDAARTQALQAEVGVKQEYGPNPRVNSVKNALENNNMFPKTLANAYVKPAFIPDEKAARALLTKVIMRIRPELGGNWVPKLLTQYRPEYFGSKYTYVYAVSNSGFEFAHCMINESGWVEVESPNEYGRFHLSEVFQFSADGRLVRMVPDSIGVYVPAE